MKKQSIIIVIGFFVISSISFAYYALLYFPALGRFNGNISDTVSGLIQWGYFLLRIALCLVFGWQLSSYRHKQYEVNIQNIFLRFIKSNWRVFVFAFALFMLYNTHNTVRDKLLPNIWDALWDFFVNHGEWTHETHIAAGTTWATAPNLFFESIFEPFTQYTYIFMYLSYKFRAALCASENQPSPKKYSTVMQ